MKTHSQIINDLVLAAADVMQAKADYLELVAKQFEDNGADLVANNWRHEIKRINTAISIIKQRAGCWA